MQKHTAEENIRRLESLIETLTSLVQKGGLSPEGLAATTTNIETLEQAKKEIQLGLLLNLYR